METMITLNVTSLEPRLKHPTIFELYDSLNPGEAFIIDNDHDPKPLYYQLLAERGQNFVWDYLENGPELWKVKIAKNKTLKNEETIGEMVTKDYRKAQVFKSFGIDFCCGGKKTITEVCKKKGIDEEELKKAMELLTEAPSSAETDYTKWNPGFLTDYIITSIRELTHNFTLPANACNSYTILYKKLDEYENDLHKHVHLENNILFPKAITLEKELRQG